MDWDGALSNCLYTIIYSSLYTTIRLVQVYLKDDLPNVILVQQVHGRAILFAAFWMLEVSLIKMPISTVQYVPCCILSLAFSFCCGIMPDQCISQLCFSLFFPTSGYTLYGDNTSHVQAGSMSWRAPLEVPGCYVSHVCKQSFQWRQYRTCSTFLRTIKSFLITWIKSVYCSKSRLVQFRRDGNKRRYRRPQFFFQLIGGKLHWIIWNLINNHM